MVIIAIVDAIISIPSPPPAIPVGPVLRSLAPSVPSLVPPSSPQPPPIKPITPIIKIITTTVVAILIPKPPPPLPPPIIPPLVPPLPPVVAIISPTKFYRSIWKSVYKISVFQHSGSLWRDRNPPGCKAPSRWHFWGPPALVALVYCSNFSSMTSQRLTFAPAAARCTEAVWCATLASGS